MKKLLFFGGKKLLFFSVVLASCKTPQIQTPQRSLAEICKDSFPCKIDSVSFVEYDTVYSTTIKVEVKDSIQVVTNEIVKEVTKTKEKVIDFKTTPEYKLFKDSLYQSNLKVQVLESTIDSLKSSYTNKLLELNNSINNKDEDNKNLNKTNRGLKILSFFMFLLLMLMAYLLGKK